MCPKHNPDRTPVPEGTLACVWECWIFEITLCRIRVQGATPNANNQSDQQRNAHHLLAPGMKTIVVTTSPVDRYGYLAILSAFQAGCNRSRLALEQMQQIIVGIVKIVFKGGDFAAY